VKLEFLQPTGSYKDRGSAVLAAAFARAGARRAVEDSSGNAGASLAAYLGRAGIALELFVPSRLSPGALGQAAAYGARVDREASDRDHAAERAMARVSEDAPYASHVTSPYFMAGVATMAFEIWEDLGRAAPDVLVVPVGQGVLALGLHYGFESLAQAGLIDRAPRIVGVQAVACAPLAAAFQEQVAEPAPITAGETRAFGVKVARPRRGAEVLAAVRATRGEIVTVTEEAIEAARRRLGREGWYVEPTGAVGMAGAEQIAGRLRPSDTVVVPLTGSGLKTMANGREGQGGLS
jgi:threonine synthase